MAAEGTRLRGTNTKWSNSYGFATAMLGHNPIDIFVHRKNFAKKIDRDTIQQHGLEAGEDIVFNVKRPRKAGRPSYEAANVSFLASIVCSDETRDNPDHAHEIPTDPQDTLASGSTAIAGRLPDQSDAMERRIADLHSSWARSAAADMFEDLTTHGTIFMGFIYIFQLNKYNTLEAGPVGQLTCREGTATFRIIQLINELGDTVDKLEPGRNIRCRILIDSDMFIERGMPFACRNGGPITAEGSVTEVLRQGQAQR